MVYTRCLGAARLVIKKQPIDANTSPLTAFKNAIAKAKNVRVGGFTLAA